MTFLLVPELILPPTGQLKTDTQDRNGCAADPSFNKGYASVSLLNVIRKLFMPKIAHLQAKAA